MVRKGWDRWLVVLKTNPRSRRPRDNREIELAGQENARNTAVAGIRKRRRLAVLGTVASLEDIDPLGEKGKNF